MCRSITYRYRICTHSWRPYIILCTNPTANTVGKCPEYKIKYERRVIKSGNGYCAICWEGMVEKEKRVRERERILEGRMQVVREEVREMRGMGLRRGDGDGDGMGMGMREGGGGVEEKMKGLEEESGLGGSVLRSESNFLEKERVLEERMIQVKEKEERQKREELEREERQWILEKEKREREDENESEKVPEGYKGGSEWILAGDGSVRKKEKARDR